MPRNAHRFSLIVLIALCQCVSPTDGTPSDGGSHLDGGVSDKADTQTQQLVADDHHAIDLLIAARNGAQNQSKAKWPMGQGVIWPAFNLHHAPTLLVMLSAKGTAKRAYLFGTAVPKDQQALTRGGQTFFRHDAGVVGLGPGERVIPSRAIADEDAMVVTWSATRDTDDVVWVTTLGRGYMTRLREVEANWLPVQACGQSLYPRFAEAIALVQLEGAVLTEALDSPTAKDALVRLQEWAAIRAAAIEVTDLVGQRGRHYDHLFGSAIFAAGRLSVAAGMRSSTKWRATLKAQLTKIATVPATEFDSYMLDSGAIGAAVIEVATSAGWDVEPTFRAGLNTFSLAKTKFSSPTPALLEAAKARHDWSGFVDRAAAIMTVAPGE
ncbi:MAG: hypothetical protein KC502_00095 [Myxococcales bacterium]|nr:hypothetical protein [Myxococcales bacterium]